MSLKRKSVGGTPSGSRARQAFKSPFRSPDTSDVSSPLLDENASSTLIQQRTQKVENINKNLDNFAERCQETPDSSKKQTSHDSKLREASVSNSTPRRVVVGRSRQIIDSCRRKVIPRQFNVPFRSPSISPVSQQSVSQEQQLTQLYKQEAEIDEEITSLKNSGYNIEELQSHIENLHQYNEIKDVAQLVMGRLAELEGVTIKEMHERYRVSGLE